MRPGERVADLATGTGIGLDALRAPPLGDAIDVVGIDRSSSMLAQVPHPLPDGWSLLEGDLRALPLDDACVDVVLCLYALHLLDGCGLEAATREIRRILAADGRCVVVTPWSPSPAGRVALAAAARLPALDGLRPLDPRPALRAAGLAVGPQRFVRRDSYPSLALRAEPAPSRSETMPPTVPR